MSNQRPQWIPFYPARWIAGTVTLTHEEEYIFFKMCMTAYEANSSFITSDVKLISRICKMPEECISNALVMLEHLNKIKAHRVDSEEGYFIQSVSDVLDDVRGQIEARSAKAKAAAEKRWSTKSIETKEKNANAMPEQCNGNANGMLGDAQYNTIQYNTVSKKNIIKRNSSMKADWVLPDNYRQFVKDDGLCKDNSAIDLVAARFKDHWLGNGSAKKDWFATWRNWCRSDYTNWPTENKSNLSESADAWENE